MTDQERFELVLAELSAPVLDVRLVAATHRDLEDMVKGGTFREDLWYRLNVAAIRAAVERASVVTQGERIDARDLPPEILAGGSDSRDQGPATMPWADVARGYLEAVLRRFDGQIAEAAAHAGVERESFYRLLRKYGVDAAAFRGAGGKGGRAS